MHYLYLSLIPEALIASMLPPEEFGRYYAVGSKGRSRGSAIFFELDAPAALNALGLGSLAEVCQPHEDGTPRKSRYLGIYRVLERVPLAALRRLWLATDDGRMLALEPAAMPDFVPARLHLYQEYCPVTPRVASRLAPAEFAQSITDPAAPVSVPRIVFAELRLQKLAEDVDTQETGDLPYPSLDHLRDCLRAVKTLRDKPSKLVLRAMAGETLYRTIRGGFYAADAGGIRFFPLPSLEDLETKHYAWWRSALNSLGS
jgi:hypothetical protein